MCWGQTLEIIYRLRDIDVFQKLSVAREPTTDDCKSQGTQMTLDSYPWINDLKLMGWNPLEGGHEGIPYHPTRCTQQSYIMWKDSIIMCSNQYQYQEWSTFKVRKIEEWPTQASTSFEQENKGEWWLNLGNIDSIYKTGTSLRHMKHR